MNHQIINVDENEIRQMFEDGFKVRYIANYMSTSPEVIRGRLRKMKLMNPPGKGRKYSQRPIGATHESYYRHLRGQFDRVCLKCGHGFKSWSKTKNRLCDKCNDENANQNFKHITLWGKAEKRVSTANDTLGGYNFTVEPDKARQKECRCPECGRMVCGNVFRTHRCFQTHLFDLSRLSDSHRYALVT